MSSMADRFKEIRREFYMTQAEMAEGLGVTDEHISGIENGLTVPSEGLRSLVCKEFGINKQWLSEGSGEMVTDKLEDAIHDNMIRSTEVVNKLLKSEDFNLRLTAARLNSLFAEIIDIGDIAEEEKLAYLNLCELLLTDINRHMGALKESFVKRKTK